MLYKLDTKGEYHAQLLGYDDHGDAGQRNSGQFGILCLSEVVEKYRRCTAVPIWMVGQGSVARRLGSCVIVGCATAISGFTVGGNRAVSLLIPDTRLRLIHRDPRDTRLIFDM